MRGANWSFDRLASKKAKNLCKRCERCRSVFWSIGKQKTKKNMRERCRLVVWSIGKQKTKRTCTRGVRGADQSFDWSASKKKNLRERCDRCQLVVWLIGKQKSKQKELLNNTQLFNKQFVLHHREIFHDYKFSSIHHYALRGTMLLIIHTIEHSLFSGVVHCAYWM